MVVFGEWENEGGKKSGYYKKDVAYYKYNNLRSVHYSSENKYILLSSVNTNSTIKVKTVIVVFCRCTVNANLRYN